MATAIEYGLISALIAVAGITAYQAIMPLPNTSPPTAKAAPAPPSASAPRALPVANDTVMAPEWVEETVDEVEYVRGSHGRCYSIANGATGPKVTGLPCDQLPRVGEIGMSSD